MAITFYKLRGRYNHANHMEFLLDDDADLASLPGLEQCAVGSMAESATSGSKWILASDGTWKPDLIHRGGGGGGGGRSIDSVSISTDGELVICFSDGTFTNLGKVVGDDGKVYVPHIDAHKVLTFTIEDAPGEVPAPTDLNPLDEWGDIDHPDMVTDYVWESIED